MIEVKDIARIAGFKTKLSVLSHKPGIEAAGTVIGPRGSRIRMVQEQVNNEHIEVIEYSDDFTTYVINVCSPAELVGIAITEPKTPEEKRYITLVTHPDKLALLIGKKGQNIRLISQLLKADVEVSTIEDARANGIEFQKIDMAAMRQQKFNSSYNKYRPGGANVLDQYNKPIYNRNAVNRNNPPIGNNQGSSTKKIKSSIFDDINKQDLLKDLQSVDTGQESGDNMEDDNSEK
ncbi:hypothetical protein FACS1894166_04560 [Bacilli bacterium]|nr:hypothetical protein FACS1894166_04560 [Bacilli bacterium]